MRFRRFLLIWIGIALCYQSATGQDIHFSHVHAAPLWVNPAFTGLFDGDVRFSANYKSQWKDFDGGFRTAAFSYDMKLAQLPKGDYLGFGIQMATDKSGAVGLSTNMGLVSFSLLKTLDGEGRHFLAAGIQTGLVARSFDVTKIVAFDQEPVFQEEGSNRASFLDASVGLAWLFTPIEGNTIYGGLSAYHIFLPNTSFFSEQSAPKETLYRRLVMNTGGVAQISDEFYLLPTFTYMIQGPNQELSVGTFLKLYLTSRKNNKKQRIGNSLGFWYRGSLRGGLNSDALITAYRLDIDRLAMTLSYDLTISKLSNAGNAVGSPEVSITYTFDDVLKGRSRSNYKGRCPTVF